MNRTTATKWLSFVLCLALIAAIALTAMGCDQAKNPETPEIPETSGNAAVTTTEGGTTPETPDPNAPIVKGEGAVVLGTDEKQLNTVKDVFLDQVKVFHASRCFGGYFGMSDDLVDFIVNWEVESYRAKVSAGN